MRLILKQFSDIKLQTGVMRLYGHVQITILQEEVDVFFIYARHVHLCIGVHCTMYIEHYQMQLQNLKYGKGLEFS